MSVAQGAAGAWVYQYRGDAMLWGVLMLQHWYHRDPRSHLGKYLCQGHRVFHGTGDNCEKTDVVVGNTGNIMRSEWTC